MDPLWWWSRRVGTVWKPQWCEDYCQDSQQVQSRCTCHNPPWFLHQYNQWCLKYSNGSKLPNYKGTYKCRKVGTLYSWQLDVLMCKHLIFLTPLSAPSLMRTLTPIWWFQNIFPPYFFTEESWFDSWYGQVFFFFSKHLDQCFPTMVPCNTRILQDIIKVYTKNHGNNTQKFWNSEVP